VDAVAAVAPGSAASAGTAGTVAAAAADPARGAAAPSSPSSEDNGGSAAASVPPFDRLPAGPPPVTVPYGIGTRVFFAGRGTDLAARFDQAFPGAHPTPAQRQFDTVVGAGGFAWTQIVGLGADLTHWVGRLSATGGYLPFHVSTGGTSALTATTGAGGSTGIVMPESGQLFDTSGGYLAAFTGSAGIDCGSCDLTAAGARLVVEQWSTPPSGPQHLGTWLWYPPRAIQQLPDGYRAVGRLGAGWLGQRQDDGCWRTASASTPSLLGARLCSQTTPLVSADGRIAVVVQSGRVLAVDRASGVPVSTATMPAMDGWQAPDPSTAGTTTDAGPGGPRYAVPAAWESADTYLVTARYDGALALVRCSASSGSCRRVVRAAVRPGVDRIVTERGTADLAR
jgi:hypothetical protein